MVIRGHVVGVAAYSVGDAVVHYINHYKYIVAAYRFIDHAFCLASAKARAVAVQQIGIHIISAVAQVCLAAGQFLNIFAAELHNVIVAKSRQLSRAASFKGATGRESLNTKLLAMKAYSFVHCSDGFPQKTRRTGRPCLRAYI